MAIFRRFFARRRSPVHHDPRAWWGKTNAQLSLGQRGLILVFFVFFVSIMAVLILGQYVRKVPAEGVLEPREGQAALISPDAGTLRKLFVRPGDRVHAGDVIAELTVLRKIAADRMDAGETAALRDSLDSFVATRNLHEKDSRALAGAAATESRRLSDEAAQAQMELGADVRAEQTASAELEKLKLLVNDGIRSAHEFSSAQIDYLRLKNESARVRQNISRIEAQEADFRERVRQEQSALVRQGTETEARINQLQVELDHASSDRSLRIIATQDGVVDSVFRQPGEAISAGDIVASISDPAVPVQALMFIGPSDIGFVRRGEEIVLQIDTFPVEQFGSVTGTITDISSTAILNSQYRTMASLKDGERSYMAVVALRTTEMSGFGEHWKLSSGMTVHGYIALEKQSLFHWLFNPVFVARGRNPYFFDTIKAASGHRPGS